MGIRSRFIQGDARSRYILPEAIHHLFEKAPAFGTIADRPTFLSTVVPACEAHLVQHEGFDFSVRPAWMAYFTAPRTHVIVTGHVLICHVLEGVDFFNQPSEHLYEEGAQYRHDKLHDLMKKARTYR